MDSFRDSETRKRTILDHLNLVHSIAHRYSDMGVPYEDLVQEGTVGLIDAYDDFDFSRNVKFSTYATWRIIGSIKHYFREKTWAFSRVPRNIKEFGLFFARAEGKLSQKLLRSPSDQEIAQELGLDIDTYNHLSTFQNIKTCISLDSYPVMEEENGNLIYIMDLIGKEDVRFDEIEHEDMFHNIIQGLSERQKRVLGYVFLDEKTQDEIAPLLNVSQMQVSRDYNQALNTLREELS